MTAVYNDPNSFEFVPKKLKTIELCLAALLTDYEGEYPNVVKFIPDRYIPPKKELVLRA